MFEQTTKDDLRIEEYKSFEMELLWECTRCGYSVHRKEGLPETCPSCNADRTEFILHKED
jgi:rubrerythrin